MSDELMLAVVGAVWPQGAVLSIILRAPWAGHTYSTPRWRERRGSRRCCFVRFLRCLGVFIHCTYICEKYMYICCSVCRQHVRVPYSTPYICALPRPLHDSTQSHGSDSTHRLCESSRLNSSAL
jgi:hypothetical protein